MTHPFSADQRTGRPSGRSSSIPGRMPPESVKAMSPLGKARGLSPSAAPKTSWKRPRMSEEKSRKEKGTGLPKLSCTRCGPLWTMA